jgi:katanin p80 WD40 repeat-containing subunit B1
MEKLYDFSAHASAVKCLSFAPKSTSILASGGDDCRVNVWRTTESAVANVWTLSNNKSPIECVCFDTDEKNILSGSMSGAIRVFDLSEGKLVRNLNGHNVSST